MPALFLVFPSGKEKKATGEGRQKTEEDIQSAEDRCNHLNKVKGKLEQSLDECEDTLEREKKAKGDVEKQKRKVEGDLKLTQEAVGDLERIKADLNAALQRKEKEALELKQWREATRKRYEERMVRKAKRAGLPADHYLSQGAAVPTADDLRALQALPKADAWPRWTKLHGQHCWAPGPSADIESRHNGCGAVATPVRIAFGS